MVAGWTLRGASSYARISDAWAAAGLRVETVPQPPSPSAALGRAVKAVAGKTVRVTPIPAVHGDGWVVSDDAGFDAEGLPLPPAHRLRVNVEGDNLVFEGLRGHSAEQPDAARIRAEYQAARTELSTTDCSSWITKLVRQHDGIPVLRDEGGVYFIPPTAANAWRVVVGAIETATKHVFGEFPAMRSDKAIDTILRALESETIKAAELIQADLAAAVAGEEKAPGVRGLSSKERVIADLRAKLARYEAMFGRPAQAACDALSRLKSNLDFTLVYASAKAEGRDADAPRLLDLSGDAIQGGVDDAAVAADGANATRMALVETDGAVEPSPVDRAAVRAAAVSMRDSVRASIACNALGNVGLAIETAITVKSGRGMLEIDDKAPRAAGTFEDDAPVRVIDLD